MKTKLPFFVIISLLFTCTLVAQEYTTKMESIFTDTIRKSAHIHHVKSALDSKNNLHVVFLGERYAYYGTNQSGSWKFESLKYFDTHYKKDVDFIRLPNIAIDEKDNIHIVTFDQYGQKLVYGKKPLNTGEFKLKTVGISPKPNYLSAFLSIDGNNADLAMDKNGGLHLICKADYRKKPDFKYSQSAIYFNKPANSEKWLIEVLIYDKQWSERNWFYGTNPSIVCYKDKVYTTFGGSNELHYCTRNITRGTWDIKRLILTPDEFINSKKWWTSLAADPNGALKFAFYEGTEDEKSLWQGVTIFSKSACGNNEWRGVEYFDNPGAKGAPAVAFDNNGKFYLALGINAFTLLHQACDCDGAYKKIYENKDNRGDFTDMVVDKSNTVYTFFSSNYDNQLHLLTAKPKSDTKKCNFPPRIVNYTGKTNLKPGEQWTATITASDSECDKIKFDAINANKMFTIKNNGNGTATITAIMPQGEGKGTPGLSVWVLDDKHPNANNEVSVINFKLIITPEGKEKGSVKIDNKCTE